MFSIFASITPYNSLLNRKENTTSSSILFSGVTPSYLRDLGWQKLLQHKIWHLWNWTSFKKNNIFQMFSFQLHGLSKFRNDWPKHQKFSILLLNSAQYLEKYCLAKSPKQNLTFFVLLKFRDGTDRRLR